MDEDNRELMVEDTDVEDTGSEATETEMTSEDTEN